MWPSCKRNKGVNHWTLALSEPSDHGRATRTNLPKEWISFQLHSPFAFLELHGPFQTLFLDSILPEVQPIYGEKHSTFSINNFKLFDWYHLLTAESDGTDILRAVIVSSKLFFPFNGLPLAPPAPPVVGITGALVVTRATFDEVDGLDSMSSALITSGSVCLLPAGWDRSMSSA